MEEYSVDQIITMAYSMKDNIGIAFTYNEPTIFYEYMVDVSQAAHLAGLKTAMITNGYIELAPLTNLLPFIDAFNVDLKAFTNTFYLKQTNSTLEPVKDTLLLLRKAQKHFEITNLIIPGFNDSLEQFTEMIEWINKKLGKDTILHLSKYFPHYQFTQPATPDKTLEQYLEIAKKKLNYVYLGNVGKHMQGHNTECPKCGTTVVKRIDYDVNIKALTQLGACANCSHPLNIVIN
jgi:pyruvate formate lyase activating enzyme